MGTLRHRVLAAPIDPLDARGTPAPAPHYEPRGNGVAPTRPPAGQSGGPDDAPTAHAPRRKPQAVIRRLSLYNRVLYSLERNRVEKVSSKDLGERLGLNSAQVRKDLAYFGQFGVPGYGYNVAELRTRLRQVLGLDRVVRVALVGVGNLGSALLAYGGFKKQNLEMVAAFDSDPAKIGTRRGGVPIEDYAVLTAKLQELGVDIAILAVPEEAAQEAADRIVAAGCEAIMNFVPRRLNVPEWMIVQHVDLSLEIESLSYYLK